MLLYRDGSHSYEVMAEKDSVAGAIKAFEKAAEGGRYLDAIVVTASGERDHLPSRIITHYDLPVLIESAFGVAAVRVGS